MQEERGGGDENPHTNVCKKKERRETKIRIHLYARKGKRNISKRYDYIEFESEYPLWREKDDSNISGVGT